MLAVLIPAAPPEPRAAAPAYRMPQADPVAELLARRAQPVPAARAARPHGARPGGVRLSRARMVAARHTRARIRVVAYARAQRGELYQRGGDGPSRWDCSGLTRRSMGVVGVRLARSSREQARHGVRVSPGNARPGDLVAYDGHVGILSGRWRMVDAPGRGRRVVERAMYRSTSFQFRRLIG